MSEETPPLRLEIAGPIAWITFDRPAVLNAIDVALAEAMLAACRQLAASPSVRVVVMRGAGKGFMAGGDLASFRAAMVPETADAIIGPFHEALEILTRLPQPVIASLHGPVAGAGVSLALAADLAIAADDAKFTVAYARIGAPLDGSASWSLPRVVGLRKAMEIALLAETFDAAEALRLTIVNRVVPAADLAAETQKLAERLAAGPTQAYGRIKALLRQSLDRPLAAQMAAERDAFVACVETSDFAEGIGAFFERRPARFTGA